jgi:hypothetical protein
VKAAIHCSWPLNVPTEFPGPVEIHVDCRKRSPKQPGVFDVLYLCEPEPILPAMTAYARGHLQLFDLVVVSTDDLVGVSPKVVPLEFGTSWIPEGATCPSKQPGISMLVGRKRRAPGHRLRHDVWNRQSEIRGPKNFFRSDRGWPRKLFWLKGFPGLDPLPANPWGWPTLGDSKLPLFSSQFHIAIENCRSRYYFTEKLIDCFLTDTVPIYWGCTNIAESFDASGIIQVETADELIAACNSTSETMYHSMAAARASNRERALRFADLGSRLGSLIAQSLL